MCIVPNFKKSYVELLKYDVLQCFDMCAHGVSAVTAENILK